MGTHGLSFSLLSALLVSAGLAQAQPADTASGWRDKPEAPPARTGFQMSLLTGVSIPAGNATGDPGDGLGKRYAWQVPLVIGLGGKPSKSVYIGAYLGLGFGAEGSDARVEAACDDADTNLENDVVCSVFSVRGGVEARYSFRPALATDPWLGVGIGLESVQQTIHDRVQRREERTYATGFDFARLSAGLNFRLGRTIGLGPMITTAFGSYYRVKTFVNDRERANASVDNPAVHNWTTVGAQVVFFP
jgi:hypothetical protein